jgi:hypothetical protein
MNSHTVKCISLFHYLRVSHQYRQAKFVNGGSIFKLEPIFATASAALKNEARCLSGQN